MTITYELLSYFLQMLLALPLLWQLCLFAHDARELFSPRTLVSGGFVGIYVASYYVASEHDRAAFLNPKAYCNLLLLSVLACYAYFLGFSIRFGGPATRQHAINRKQVCWYSLALIAIGFAALITFVQQSGGFLAFYGSPHGQGGAWTSTSAYLYALPSFMLPAAFLLYAMHVRGGLPNMLFRAALAVTAAYLIFQSFVFGNRGDTISLLFLLVLPPLFLAGRFRISKFMMLLYAAATLTAVLVFPYLRDALHLGAEKNLSVAIGQLLSGDMPELSGSNVSGHELFFAAASVDAAAELNVHDFGLAYLYPFVNLVPRAWWPDKPYFDDWTFDMALLVEEHAGWIVERGSAATGVAEAFISISWFSVVVWVVLGCWGGWVWRRAKIANDVVDVGYLWAYLVMAVYFVTQGYVTAWHAWQLLMVPIWVSKFVTLDLVMTSQRTPPPRRTRPSNGRPSSPGQWPSTSSRFPVGAAGRAPDLRGRPSRQE